MDSKLLVAFESLAETVRLSYEMFEKNSQSLVSVSNLVRVNVMHAGRMTPDVYCASVISTSRMNFYVIVTHYQYWPTETVLSIQ